jgi:hypothetical protein
MKMKRGLNSGKGLKKKEKKIEYRKKTARVGGAAGA